MTPEQARAQMATLVANNQPGGAPIFNWEMVELSIPSGATGRINFATQAKLRNQADQIVWITNIELFPDTSYAFSQQNNNVPGMPGTEIPKGVLVLNVSGWEKQHFIPLAKLVHINDQQNPFQFWMQNFITMEDVDWEQSYVQFNQAADNTAYVMPFGITYIKANIS